MERREIEELFAKASRLDETRQGYLREEEWLERRKHDGAKTFKRKALGLCGRSSVKSLDEMAWLLYYTGIVTSIEEGRKLTPPLVGGRVSYGIKEMLFSEVQNAQGNKAYRIDVVQIYTQ